VTHQGHAEKKPGEAKKKAAKQKPREHTNQTAYRVAQKVMKRSER
jgi:hypothetical protein